MRMSRRRFIEKMVTLGLLPLVDLSYPIDRSYKVYEEGEVDISRDNFKIYNHRLRRVIGEFIENEKENISKLSFEDNLIINEIWRYVGSKREPEDEFRLLSKYFLYLTHKLGYFTCLDTIQRIIEDP